MSLTGLIKLILETFIVCLLISVSTRWLEKTFNILIPQSILIPPESLDLKKYWAEFKADPKTNRNLELRLAQLQLRLPAPLKVLASKSRFIEHFNPVQNQDIRSDDKLRSSLNQVIEILANKNALHYQQLKIDGENSTIQALKDYAHHVVNDERLYKISEDFSLAINLLKFMKNQNHLSSDMILPANISWRSCPLCGELKDVFDN